MVVAEKIQEYIRRLPPSFQKELLDYAECLLEKAGRADSNLENDDWTAISLAAAMRGMDDEETAAYGPSDLIEKF